MKLFALFIFAIICISASLHAIHISYSRLDFVDSQLKITTKIFSDDFEKSLSVAQNCTECSKSEIEKYFNKTFKISSANKTYQLKVDSVVTKENTHWAYMHTSKITGNSIQIKNSIHCNIYEDQQNLCITYINGKEKGYSLDFNSREFTINLK